MAKIKNPILFSEYFGIDPNVLGTLKILDPVLNVDTKLFIDPLLLKYSEFELINVNAVEQYTNRYSDIIKLLTASNNVGDKAWKSARSLFPQKEVEGTCLGYGINSTTGRSIPEEIHENILLTASEILSVGINDPDLFILIPLFEEKIGPDTISDITTALIVESLLDFTIMMAEKLSIPTIDVTYNDKNIKIIRNPLKQKDTPIILLPKDILGHLPVVNSFEDIADAASFNAALRNRVNKMLALIFRAKTTENKQKARREILHDKKNLETLLMIIKNAEVEPYDFDKDKFGLISLQNLLYNVSVQNPFLIDKVEYSEDSLRNCVLMIINQFKFLVEEKGLNKLFWKNKYEHNNEKIVQMVFFATAYSYCKSNNIDINPEMDTGRGYVDFKFSKGFIKKVVVEIKNSYNPNVIKGFKNQLDTYKNSEETLYGFYIIVDLGGLGSKYKQLMHLYHNDEKKQAEIILIDGKQKPSASKIH